MATKREIEYAARDLAIVLEGEHRHQTDIVPLARAAAEKMRKDNYEIRNLKGKVENLEEEVRNLRHGIQNDLNRVEQELGTAAQTMTEPDIGILFVKMQGGRADGEEMGFDWRFGPYPMSRYDRHTPYVVRLVAMSMKGMVTLKQSIGSTPAKAFERMFGPPKKVEEKKESA